MATETTYNYRFQDTADGNLYNSKLRNEIHDSPDIIVACVAINGEDEDFFVVMKDVLDQAQEDALNAVVAAHNGNDAVPPVHPSELDNYVMSQGLVLSIAPGATEELSLSIQQPQWLKAFRYLVKDGSLGDRLWVRVYESDGTTLKRVLINGAYWKLNDAEFEYDLRDVPIELGSVFKITYTATGAQNTRRFIAEGDLWKSF